MSTRSAFTVATLFAVVSIAAGCGASGPESSTVRADGPLLGLGEEADTPAWRGLTPTPGTERTPDALEAQLRAFDYWEVGDRRVVSEVWSAVFPVLDTLRTDTSREAERRSLGLLLEAIEPKGASRPTRMDVTFVVGRTQSAPYEGVACRLFRTVDNGGTPSVTILLLRRSASPATPGRILVWGSPGFEGMEAWTADFSRDDETWSTALVSGLHFPSDRTLEQTSGATNESTRVAARLLTRRLWKRFSGTSYASSTPGEEAAPPPPDGLAEALGLEVGDRRIDQVYSDTQFPPRADISLGEGRSSK